MKSDEAYAQYRKDEDLKCPPVGESSVNALIFIGKMLSFVLEREQKAFYAGWRARASEEHASSAAAKEKTE